MAIIDQPPGQGVLAFGDSITNGGGELQYGVALQSWALWVARGLGLPFTTYAVDGARVHDVVSVQQPAHHRINASTDARYELGCLYIGVNDVREERWDAAAFERDLNTAHGRLRTRCERALAVTIPLDLGRPPAAPRVAQANAIIERAACGHRALLLDLSGFGDRQTVMADRVHPTALGQIEIAERALRTLAADGLPTRVAPRSLITYHAGPRSRARHEARYAWRSARTLAATRWSLWPPRRT